MLPLLRRCADSELTLLVLLAPGGSSVNAACTSNCRAVTVADSLPLALLLVPLPLLKPATVLTDSMGVTFGKVATAALVALYTYSSTAAEYQADNNMTLFQGVCQHTLAVTAGNQYHSVCWQYSNTFGPCSSVLQLVTFKTVLRMPTVPTCLPLSLLVSATGYALSVLVSGS
jgi:hypothetical protein